MYEIAYRGIVKGNVVIDLMSLSLDTHMQFTAYMLLIFCNFLLL